MSGTKSKLEEEYVVTLQTVQAEPNEATATATPSPGSVRDRPVRLHQHVIDYLADLLIDATGTTSEVSS